MDIEVYCDETLPDLFTSKRPGARFLMIGSLWIPAGLRSEAKSRISELRERHSVWGEIKWTKVTPSKQLFYEELVGVFASFGKDMRFRCIAVDREKVDFALCDNDEELGFYKFYYQLLHHWILDFNKYHVFCDLKENRHRKRLRELRESLTKSNLSATIADVQSLPSSEVVLLQLCDLLLGAASSRLNGRLAKGSAKEAVVRKLEESLELEGTIAPTSRAEKKFNVFEIQLDGGW